MALAATVILANKNVEIDIDGEIDFRTSSGLYLLCLCFKFATLFFGCSAIDAGEVLRGGARAEASNVSVVTKHVIDAISLTDETKLEYRLLASNENVSVGNQPM